VHGIDPSDGQLAYARLRPVSRVAQFQLGDAMALPFPDDAFDAAVMPLVIFFVPEPARGVAEMARVIRPGGLAAAYAWDMDGGGFPYEPLLAAIRELGVDVPDPPSPEASRTDVLTQLWTDAGFEGVHTREIAVERTFADFDDYWTTVQGSPSAGGRLKAMTPETLALLEARMRERLRTDATGRITCSGRANAIKGHHPAHAA
jgi:SAM-dependent methyltransferase